jgi:DNA-binding FrmR family transcriptional regulator
MHVVYTIEIPYPLGYFLEKQMADSKDDVIRRLKRIEGQVRGLQRMMDEDQDCGEVILQLCAARKALDKVGFMMLCRKMQDCMKNNNYSTNPEAAMEEAMKLFLTLA